MSTKFYRPIRSTYNVYTYIHTMCALSPSALIPIENFKALFLGFLFLRFLKCCVQDKKN